MSDDVKKVAIVVSEGTFDKAMMAVMIANTAASMGMEVHIFYTFFGLPLLKKEVRPKLPGFYRLFTGVFEKRMSKSKIPLYKESRALAQELGVNLYACSTSMSLMNMTQEDLMDGVKIIGAAGFLDLASDTDMQYFIG